jgi:hypothetical protein
VGERSLHQINTTLLAIREGIDMYPTSWPAEETIFRQTVHGRGIPRAARYMFPLKQTIAKESDCCLTKSEMPNALRQMRTGELVECSHVSSFAIEINETNIS